MKIQEFFLINQLQTILGAQMDFGVFCSKEDRMIA
jgi:hypothetical protein